MKRLDRLLADYDKEREKAKTLKEVQKANKKLVEAIQALPGEKTQTEQMILALFQGMTS